MLYVSELLKELSELEDEGPLDEEDEERRDALKELEDELGGFAAFEDNFSDGLIPESEFEDYAQQLAEDCGMIERDSQMSFYVDWARWSDDCKQDYSSVAFEGDTYYYR